MLAVIRMYGLLYFFAFTISRISLPVLRIPLMTNALSGVVVWHWVKAKLVVSDELYVAR